jgi:hypothetical protein
VTALNKVDLPTFGKPTIPARNIINKNYQERARSQGLKIGWKKSFVFLVTTTNPKWMAVASI